MPKNIRTYIAICTLVLLAAFNASAQQTFKISGTLPDSFQGEVTILIDKSYLHRRQETVIAQITDHHFEATLTLDRNRIIELVHPAFHLPIYANPGDSLNLTFITEPSASISLTGKGAQENNFMQFFFNKFGKDFEDTTYSEKSASTIDDYEGFLFSIRRRESDYLKDTPSYAGLSSDFKKFIENQINYNYWYRLFSYPIINANKSTQILKVNPLPDVMLDGFQKVKVDNPEAMLCQPYLDFLKYYIIYETSKANGFNKFTDGSISADRKSAVARAKFSNPTYLYWATRFTTEECDKLSPFMTKKLFASVKELDKDRTFQQIIIDVCGAKMNAPDDGKKPEDKSAAKSNDDSDDFSGLDLTDENGKSVSLSSFKGKVVYIDFWASWCGPCRMMMPFSKQLHGQLTEKEQKQIIFLYISIDADQNAWKKAMTDMGIEGVKVISPGNWNSKACSFFQINSIPRYMIMDKKGKIVDFNAKRPADPTILDQLRELVAQ